MNLSINFYFFYNIIKIISYSAPVAKFVYFAAEEMIETNFMPII